MAEPRLVEAWECAICGMLFMDPDEAEDCCMDVYRRINIYPVEP